MQCVRVFMCMWAFVGSPLHSELIRSFFNIVY